MQTTFALTHSGICLVAKEFGRKMDVLSELHEFHRACCSGILYGRAFPGEFEGSPLIMDIRNRPAHQEEYAEVQLLSYAAELTFQDGPLQHQCSPYISIAALEVAKREWLRKSGIKLASQLYAPVGSTYGDPFFFGVALSEIVRTPRLSRLSVK